MALIYYGLNGHDLHGPTQTNFNKKVLLHECKRHTACHIANTCYAALCNGGEGGAPSQVLCRGGYPISGLGGYPISGWGVPPIIQTWSGGYPPDLGWGTPPSQTWDGVPPPTIQTWTGYPPRNVNRQTLVKTIPSRHTTYAGSKKPTVVREMH